MLAYIGLCICLDCNSCIYCYIVKDDCTHSCLADLHGYQRRALRRSYVTLMCGTHYFLYAAALRRGGGIEPLHVSMPRELKSRPSTSPTHPGQINYFLKVGICEAWSPPQVLGSWRGGCCKNSCVSLQLCVAQCGRSATQTYLASVGRRSSSSLS